MGRARWLLAALLLGCDPSFFAGVLPPDAGEVDAAPPRVCPRLGLRDALPPRPVSVSAMARVGREVLVSVRPVNLPRTATTARFLALDGVAVRTTTIALEDLVAYSAQLAPDGALWVAGGTAAGEGRIDVLRAGGATTSTRTALPLSFITGSRGAGEERWAQEHPSFGGAVLHFDGAAWRRVWSPIRDGERAGAVLAWAAEGEAYFAPPRGPCDAQGLSCIFRYERGALTAESLETASNVTSLRWIEGIGAVVGTKVGRVLVRRPRGGAVWNDLDPEAPYVAEAIDLITPYLAGFLAFTRSWILYYDGRGFCPPERVEFAGGPGETRVFAAEALGDRVLLGGGQVAERSALLWADPR